MLWNKEVCLGGWPMMWLEGTVLKYLFRARETILCLAPDCPDRFSRLLELRWNRECTDNRRARSVIPQISPAPYTVIEAAGRRTPRNMIESQGVRHEGD
jgi:hypothetical protein